MTTPTPGARALANWYVRGVVSRSHRCWMAVLCGDTSTGPVTTTPIARIDGRTVTTRSGSVYLLVGPPPYGDYQFAGPDGAPLDRLGPGYRAWFLADGVTAWPPGSAVDAVPADELEGGDE